VRKRAGAIEALAAAELRFSATHRERIFDFDVSVISKESTHTRLLPMCG
jgi:hypothetical protein